MLILNQFKNNRKEAYVEVLEVLKHMDSKYVEKVPIKLREFLKKNASKEYKFYLDKSIPFEEQKLNDITINILAMLNYHYWCEDEEHKKYLLKRYNENERKYQEALQEKYSRDKLFNRERKNTGNMLKNDNNAYLENYEDKKWYVMAYENVSEFVAKFIKKILN